MTQIMEAGRRWLWERPLGRRTLLLASVLVVGVCFGSALLAQGYAGDDACMVCHEQVVREFSRTAHAFTPGWGVERGCENCHGPGAEHVDSDGDPSKIVNPAELRPAEASEACVSCHSRQLRQWGFESSLHRHNGVSCTSCHDPHSTAEHLLRMPATELCSSCHQGIAAQFQLPRSHPLSPDQGCVGCHDPHGTKNVRTLLAFDSDNCLDCHIEYRGPFIYAHDVGLVDGCQSCHEVHGSTNRHLLRHERQVNLCYQCHAGTETPTFHSFNNFVNEKCTACHTAIHGSNTNPFFLEE